MTKWPAGCCSRNGNVFPHLARCRPVGLQLCSGQLPAHKEGSRSPISCSVCPLLSSHPPPQTLLWVALSEAVLSIRGQKPPSWTPVGASAYDLEATSNHRRIPVLDWNKPQASLPSLDKYVEWLSSVILELAAPIYSFTTHPWSIPFSRTSPHTAVKYTKVVSSHHLWSGGQDASKNGSRWGTVPAHASGLCLPLRYQGHRISLHGSKQQG